MSPSNAGTNARERVFFSAADAGATPYDPGLPDPHFPVAGLVGPEATAPPGDWTVEELEPRHWYERTKRLTDIALSLIALPVALPVIAACAALVWIESPGAPLFRQQRTGRGGRRFAMFKIRTMVANAEQLKVEYQHLNELSWPDFKIANDPRITRIGRVLRATSLDELPQIFNVLLGDMSWVGPRPTSFSADTYQPWHRGRLAVQPGITGLWQIRGRSDIDFDERVRLDLEYIRRRGFWFDWAILFATVFAVLRRRGAR
jgi:lipopolysaccharide/colanic/teichoic acid biosynthesis glycosyltransferase